jgi:predicted Zn finger-like uncharacterized protein
VIITCERCSTQFRLDDERVPEQGVRVRCSRCKYAFHVEPPASSENERIQRAAARGLEPDTPEITQDLPDEEEDWKFNDDRPAGDEGESDAGEVLPEPDAEDGRSPLDGVVAGPGDAYGFGTDAASQPAGALAGDADDAPLAASGLDLEGRSAYAAPELQAEPAGPFDLSAQDGAGSGLDLAGSADPAPDLDPGAAGEGAPDASQDPEKSPRAAEGFDASEEIGSPDKWDFFASDSSEKVATSPRVRLIAMPPRAKAPRSASVPRDLVDEDAPLHSPWLERIVNTVGWGVVAAVFAVGLYGGLAPGARGSAPALGSQRVSDLQISEVGGRWIDNLVAGDLYVVSGVVRRDAAGSDVADAGLFLILLDAQGERLRLAPIPVGPPLPQALLRQAGPEDLRRAAGQALSPEPRAAQRIEAVIPAPPAAASAFRFVTGEELAALNLGTPVPQASADGVDPSDASGEMLPPEPEIRLEEPIEAP